MNTAECVIEGHGIDIEATGRSVYIKVIHWCSFLFTLAVFYLLTSFIEHCRKEGWSEKTTGRKHTNSTGPVVCWEYAIIKEMYELDIFPTVGLLLEEQSV